MTSPSETPLDLDHVKALADMRAAARSARSELAKGSTNDHQRPGERFPSHDEAELGHSDTPSHVDGNASAFRGQS